MRKGDTIIVMFTADRLNILHKILSTQTKSKEKHERKNNEEKTISLSLSF